MVLTLCSLPAAMRSRSLRESRGADFGSDDIRVPSGPILAEAPLPPERSPARPGEFCLVVESCLVAPTLTYGWSLIGLFSPTTLSAERLPVSSRFESGDAAILGSASPLEQITIRGGSSMVPSGRAAVYSFDTSSWSSVSASLAGCAFWITLASSFLNPVGDSSIVDDRFSSSTSAPPIRLPPLSSMALFVAAPGNGSICGLSSVSPLYSTVPSAANWVANIPRPLVSFLEIVPFDSDSDLASPEL
mmetsp:Transcript_5246/g.11785  ORF Transcript_5246/g.11785 Transcript_5246/m.11785 type:complete len:246 (-) Transcript_5246:1347-2084(-)